MKVTTVPELQLWLASMQELAERKTCKSPEFLRPFHFVTLALTLRSQKAEQIAIPGHLSSYASRMKLWQAVGISPPAGSSIEHDATGKFLPLEPLNSRDTVFDCSSRLASITTHANIDSDSIKGLDTSIAELVDNCFAHALVTDDLHGVACAQHWPKGRLAQIAIADMGIGFRKGFENADTAVLRERVKYTNACQIATELGVTSKSSAGHAGYGLALARQLMEMNEGTLIVYSGQEWFCSARGKHTSGTMGVNWPGSIVVCEFNTNRPLNTADVYAEWPPVRGYENDDFDF